jgi:hypothetical protein
VNWGNPITRDLDYAVTNGVECVSGKSLGPTVGSSALGRTQRLTVPYKASADVAACTIIAHHKYTSDNADYAGVVWGFYASSSDNSQIGVGLGNLGAGTAAGDLYGVNRANGPSQTTLNIDPPLPYEGIFCSRATLGSGSNAAFLYASTLFGGTAVTSLSIAQSGSAAFAVDTRRSFSVMTPTSTGKESTFAFKWHRLLSDSEVSAVMSNPWQLFAPRRILTQGPSSSNLIVPNMDAHADTISNSTARPYVQVAW